MANQKTENPLNDSENESSRFATRNGMLLMIRMA